jgi:hypothetical protein
MIDMVHPCRSREDTGGNPKFKMHACALEDSTETICGLPTVIDVNVLAGYTSLCRTCFPRVREEAWTKEGGGNAGDAIEGRED